MTSPIDPNAFLMGSGVKSASFAGTPPITYSGPIVAPPEVRQQTKLEDGTPLTFADGSPRLQLIVQIQTTERVDADDDGVRSLYIKANSQKAVADAVRKAGATGLEVGGVLTLTYTADDLVNAKRGFTPPKLYAATYQPPNTSGQFLGTGQPQAQQPQQAPQPYANGYQQHSGPIASSIQPQQQAMPQGFANPAQPTAPAPAPAVQQQQPNTPEAILRAAGIDPNTMAPGTHAAMAELLRQQVAAQPSN
jgi:hypothetical protein